MGLEQGDAITSQVVGGRVTWPDTSHVNHGVESASYVARGSQKRTEPHFNGESCLRASEQHSLRLEMDLVSSRPGS